jgi:hypothetical protein
VELGRVLVAWLRDYRWEVYQEVQVRRGGPIADVVAVQKPLVWVIEMKTQPTLALVEQVLGWKGNAHYLSVATRREPRAWYAWSTLLRAHGIGHLVVSAYDQAVHESLHPALNRRVPQQWNILASLRPEQQTWAEAGSREGTRATPFQITCAKVREFVAAHPGAGVKDIVASIEHHYATPATARGCLLKWVRHGAVAGVICRQEGRGIAFYAEPGERGGQSL